MSLVHIVLSVFLLSQNKDFNDTVSAVVGTFYKMYINKLHSDRQHEQCQMTVSQVTDGTVSDDYQSSD